MPLAFCSYQTTHGTVSALPVKAKSGSMPSRVGSMLRVGSPVADEAGAPGLRRLAPVCCQQNALTLVPPPGALVEQSVCLIPREAKIWFLAASSLAPPSFSCQATHGTGSLPATAAPPTSAGFSAVRSGWMFSEGTRWAGARSWPSGIQVFAAASKRLAKMFVLPPARFAFGSYHAVHGTLRPVPAKSIDGASASWAWSRLSERPWVIQRPPLNARTKICCEAPDFCSNAAHGTFGRAGDERPADDVGRARVLVRVDADGGVVVDLGAVGGQADDGGGRGAGEREHGDEGRRREAPAAERPGHEASLGGRVRVTLQSPRTPPAVALPLRGLPHRAPAATGADAAWPGVRRDRRRAGRHSGSDPPQAGQKPGKWWFSRTSAQKPGDESAHSDVHVGHRTATAPTGGGGSRSSTRSASHRRR